ncbi:precorrin-2 C(20)-methyltransferase [Propionicimonas sp.]|uniref:precorrin-2 C(20)-methyltransferase n=1 Tax=Propionicimonas sp. TaxID=1955623 RepID=UPI0039E4E045
MATPAVSTPTLVGVGVGPGDPELVTLKAARILAQADVVLVPRTETSGDDAGRAEQVVLAACPAAASRLRRVPFSMAQRAGVGTTRRKSWEASAQAAVEAFRAGAATVAFATVGDPSVYSTFSYLAAHVQAVVPGVDVSVVPGITAMQALAAASLTPLVEGRESLTLVPVTDGLATVSAALAHSDTVVAYKGGRRLGDLLGVIRDAGRDGVLGVNIGLPGETILPLAEVDAESAPYFSTVLVAPVRTETGGRL